MSPHIMTIATKDKREVLDITDQVTEQYNSQFPDFKNGLLHLYLLHTSAALTIADMDPGTGMDYLDAFEAMVPKLDYRHMHDPSHMPSHIIASLIKPGFLVPIVEGELQLGMWQRIVLMELDGPAEREIILSAIKAEE